MNNNIFYKSGIPQSYVACHLNIADKIYERLIRLSKLTHIDYYELFIRFSQFTKTTTDFILDDLDYCIERVLAGKSLPF